MKTGTFRILGVLLLVLTLNTCMIAQVFPLKVSDNKGQLVTRNNIPVLLNGISLPLFSDVENAISNIPRLGYLGVNAVYIIFPDENADLTAKGNPGKEVQKNVRSFKRFTREAALYNISVFLSAEKAYIRDSTYQQYFEFLFHKTRRFKNVIWLIDDEQTSNSPHLTGAFSHAGVPGAGFSVITNLNQLTGPIVNPSVLLINCPLEQTDSVQNAIRSLAYRAVLRGCAGLIVKQPENKNSVYQPVTYHMKQLKTVFDTLHWEHFKPVAGIFSKPMDTQVTAASADSSSAILYISEYSALTLNLFSFGPNVNLTWVNPVNGSVFRSQASSLPADQLFLPPFNQGKKSDWLLIIKAAQP